MTITQYYKINSIMKLTPHPKLYSLQYDLLTNSHNNYLCCLILHQSCAWPTIGSFMVSSGCERVPCWRGLQSAVCICPPKVPELHSAGMREKN